MVKARRATAADVAAICRICSDGWRETYSGRYSEARIERTIDRFYTPQRVTGEIDPAPGWDGWWVAVDDAEQVVAAGGGGMTGPETGEIFVLYADPTRRRQGAGTALLDTITAVQVGRGAREQWVAVAEGNDKGIPFYEARGFIRRGTRPPYETDEPEAADSVLFWRRLA
jgi:ribosomal protein S18 acetylase RimI-like enzyme